MTEPNTGDLASGPAEQIGEIVLGARSQRTPEAREEYLRQACGDDAAKNCGRTCSVTRTDAAVVLSVRGDNPEGCCVGVMTAAATGNETEPAKAKKS